MPRKPDRKADAPARPPRSPWFRPRLERLEDRLAPAVYEVVNTLDSGPGSLRQAILDANDNPGPDLITFNIPGSGVQTIRPQSALPSITDTLLIDGYSQSGSSANTRSLSLGSGAQGTNAILNVEIDGSDAVNGFAGLLFASGAVNSEVRGLVINRFLTGVRVVANETVVAGCFIGTDASGSQALGNAHGVSIGDGAVNVRVGGTTPADRNVISGNSDFGLFVNGDGHRIQGNFIGTDATGAADLGNGDIGVYVTRTFDAEVSGNLISGNRYEGVTVAFAQGVRIHRNFIGTDRTGSAAIPNDGFGGVFIRGEGNPPSWDTFTSAEIVGNVISGNKGYGIQASQSPGTTARPHYLNIAGNLIGVAADNVTPLGNTSIGIGASSPFIDQATLHITDNHVANNPFGGIYLAAPQPAAVLRHNLLYGNGGTSGNLDIGQQGAGGAGIWASANITSATVSGTSLTFTGSFQGTPSTYYSLDLFASPTELTGGHRAARAYVSSFGTTTNASGQASFTFSVPAGLHLIGQYLTTTLVGVGTSELSAPVLIQAASGAPNVYTVTNTNNSGAGSLRQAILDANAHAGPDLIRFNISGAGPHFILPTSPLPAITDPVSIDGYTQPGANPNTNPLSLGAGARGSNAALMIGVDGKNLSAGASLLTVDAGADSSILRGLVLNRSPGDGITVHADGVVIEGNFIGTTSSGSTARANAGSGIVLVAAAADGARIGGTSPAARNVISANGQQGILGYGSGHAVLGNLIGTDASGTRDLGNAQAGVYLLNGTNSLVGAGVGNLISGNNGAGVRLVEVENASVLSNFIGTDVTGTAILGNLDGVVFVASNSGGWPNANSVTIGGPQFTARNVISGNAANGIVLSTVSSLPSTAVVTGNLIGLGAVPLTPLDNAQSGVRLNGSGSGGGGIAATLSDNVIAHNGGAGVAVPSVGASSLVTQGNSIYLNGGLGIDIGATGVTTGGSSPVPTLASATYTATSVTVNGTLQAAANTTYEVEFFANAAPDPSGYGEGQRPLGRQNVTTNGAGLATYSFTVSIPTVFLPGLHLSATARRSGGVVSEFSQTITATSDNGDATARSTQLRDGVNALFSSLPGWGPSYNLGVALPVVSSALGTLFGVQQAIAQQFAAFSVSVTSSYDQLRAQLEAIPGVTVRHCSAAQGVEVVYARGPGTPLTASGNTYNDATPDVLRSLAQSLNLDGDFTLTATLELELAFGVDAGGFYLLPESELRLNVTGAGSISGSGSITGDSGTVTGSGDVDLVVTLSPDDGTAKYRTTDLSMPGAWLQVAATGTAGLGLEVDLGAFDLEWSGTWAVTTTTQVNVDLDTTQLDAAFALPGLKVGSGGDAIFTLHGTYASNRWTLTGHGEDYRLAGFTVDTLDLSVQTSPTAFTASGSITISADLADEDAITFSAQVNFPDRDRLQIHVVKTIDAYVGTDPVLLWIDDGKFTFDFDANLDAGTFAGKIDVTAAAAVFLPKERRPAGQTPSGPLTLTDLTGSLDATGALRLHVGSVAGVLGEGDNALRLTATGGTLDLGPGDPAGKQVLSIDELKAQFPFLGRQLTLSGTGLHYTRADGLTVNSLRLEAGDGLVAIGGVVPFTVTSLQVQGNGGGPIRLDSFSVTVAGTVDLSVFDALPGTPIFRIGEQAISGPAQPLDLTLRVTDGRVTVERTGPITVGFEGLTLGPLTAGATLTLGQIIDGKLDTSQQRFTLDLDSSPVNLVADVSITTSGGVTTLDGSGSVTFPRIAPEGMPFTLTDLAMALHLNLKLGPDLRPIGTPSLTFESGLVGGATLEVNDWVRFEATETRFNFQAEDDDVFVTFGRLRLVFGEGFEVLDGWHGEAGGFGVRADGQLVLFDNAFADVKIPPGADIEWPDWLPIRFDRLGFRFGDQTIQGVPASFSAPDPLAQPLAVLDDLRDFSIIVSGGFERNAMWPITASVDGLEINVPRLVDYARGVPGAPFPFRLPGGSIGVGPFDLGENLSVRGQLSFGTVEHAGREAMYVIVVGGLQYQDIGADVTLAISTFGPVIASVSVPLAVPLGPTGFLLSGVTGALLFAHQVPDVDGPQSLIDPKNDSRFANPLDQVQADGIDAFVRDRVLASLREGRRTWEQPFTLLLSGAFTHVAAAGLVSGTLTLGANVAWRPDPGVSRGVKLLGFGSVSAIGIPLGEMRTVLDLTAPLEPKLDFAFSTTTTNNPITFLFPVNATYDVRIDTKGLVPGVLLGLRTFVQRVGQAGLTAAELFFRDALDRVADAVRAGRPGLLVDVLYGGSVPNLSAAVFRIDFRQRLLNTIAANIDTLTADPGQLLRLSRMGQELVRQLLDELQARMPANPEDVFAELTDGFGQGVKDLLRGGKRALIAFAELMKEGIRQAAVDATELFDPAVLIRGKIQPQIFGVPLGHPTNAVQLRFGKRGLFVSFAVDATRFSLLPALGTAALAVPLPFATVTRFDLQFPFANGFRDLALGRIPGFAADSPNWLVGVSQTAGVLGFESQLTGMLFPRGNEGLMRDRVQIVDADNDGVRDAPLDPLKLQVPNQALFDRLVAHGGFLFDGSLRLPRLLTDPFGLIAQLDGFLPDPEKDPLRFFEALTRLPAALGEQEQVGQFQLFIPDLFQTGLTSAQRNARANAAYLEGFLTHKLLGLELSRGRISADAQRFLVSGHIDALGLDAQFQVDNRNGQFPRLMAEVGLTSARLAALLVKIGLPADWVNNVASASSKLRVFSPGFDPASSDRIKTTGRIEFAGKLAIPGVLGQALFAFKVTPGASGLVPDFVARGQVSSLSLPGMQSSTRLRLQNFTVELSKQGSSLAIELDGSAVLFGKNLRAAGRLVRQADGWVGVLTLSARDAKEASVGSGFTLSGGMMLAVNTTSTARDMTVAGKVVTVGRGGLFVVDGRLGLKGFVLDGRFRMSASGTAVTVAGDAELGLRGFGHYRAAGSFTVSDAGLIGSFGLTVDRLSNKLFALEGNFRLEVNTSDTVRTVSGVTLERGVSIEVNNVNLHLKPLGDLFRLTGSARIEYRPNGPGLFDDVLALVVPEARKLKLELFKNTVPGFNGFTGLFSGEVRSDGFINLTASLAVNARIFDLGLSGSAKFTLRRELNDNIRFGAAFTVTSTWKGNKVAGVNVSLTPEGLLTASVSAGTPLFDAHAAVFFNLRNGTWGFNRAEVKPPDLPRPPETAQVNLQVAVQNSTSTSRMLLEDGLEVLEVTVNEGSLASSPVSVILYLSLRGNIDASDRVIVRLLTPASNQDVFRLERGRAIRGQDFTSSTEDLSLGPTGVQTRAFTIVPDRDFELTEMFDIVLEVVNAQGLPAENVTLTVPRVRVRVTNDDAARPANALAFYDFNTGNRPVLDTSRVASGTALVHSRGPELWFSPGLPDGSSAASGAAASRRWAVGRDGVPYFEFTIGLKPVAGTSYYTRPEITGLAFWSRASTQMDRWELRWSEDDFRGVLAQDELTVWLTREDVPLSLAGKLTLSSAVTFRLYGLTRSPDVSGEWWIDNVALLGAVLPSTLESGGTGDDGVGKTLATAHPLGSVGASSVVRSEAIQTPLDVDLYSVTVSAGQTLTFDIDTPTNSTLSVNAHLRLFDDAGRELASNRYARAPGDPAPILASTGTVLSTPRTEGGANGFDPYLVYQFPAAGTYYVGVSNGANTGYNPVTGAVGAVSGTAGVTGRYELVVTDLNYYHDLVGAKLTAPARAKVGDTITVQSQVRNDGAHATSAFTVRWYLSRDPIVSADDLELRLEGGAFSYQHPSIPANSAGPLFGVRLQVPAIPDGWHGTTFYIVQKVDAANAVVEVNEANNSGVGLTRDVVAINVSRPKITGVVRADFSPSRDHINVFLQRIDGQPIAFDVPTWLVIHGRADDSSSFVNLANVIAQSAKAIPQSGPFEQVLLLDWSEGSKDNHPFLGIDEGLDGAGWIPFTGEWVSGVLATLGVTSAKLRLVGHSWGSYMAYEIAKRVPGKSEVIVALDPATAARPDRYPYWEVNFGAESAQAWAFYGDGLFGSASLASTADAAFVLKYDQLPVLHTGKEEEFPVMEEMLRRHSAPIHLFTTLLEANLGSAPVPLWAKDFALSKLLTPPPTAPWRFNRYGFFFEGEFTIRDENGNGDYGDGTDEVKGLRFISASTNVEVQR